jgi:hypothetical protein
VVTEELDNMATFGSYTLVSSTTVVFNGSSCTSLTSAPATVAEDDWAISPAPAESSVIVTRRSDVGASFNAAALSLSEEEVHPMLLLCAKCFDNSVAQIRMNSQR